MPLLVFPQRLMDMQGPVLYVCLLQASFLLSVTPSAIQNTEGFWDPAAKFMCSSHASSTWLAAAQARPHACCEDIPFLDTAQTRLCAFAGRRTLLLHLLAAQVTIL